jgi:hypothetical protein
MIDRYQELNEIINKKQADEENKIQIVRHAVLPSKSLCPEDELHILQ